MPFSTPLPTLQAGERMCATGVSVRGGRGGQSTPTRLQAQGATLDEFSELLHAVVGRPVINKTGVIGRFEIRVKFASEGTSDSADLPLIFIALQEQLGLRLESGRGPVEMLVIDGMERPSEN